MRITTGRELGIGDGFYIDKKEKEAYRGRKNPRYQGLRIRERPEWVGEIVSKYVKEVI